MTLDRLYLDYNATSPLSQSVLSWLKSGEVFFANPASQHSSGKAARKIINEARAFIYQVFSRSEKDTRLFVHSGATEAFLTFAAAFSETARKEGRNLLICHSRIDHPAVTSLSQKFLGPHVKFLELRVDRNLTYLHQENFEAIQDKKDNDPELLILYHHLWVHNETGLVSALGDLSRFKAIKDLYLHVDAVQAPGKIPDWKRLEAGDIWTFSAHKFGALKGIGFSLLGKDVPFEPLLTGGGQQSAMRSGTESATSAHSIYLALGDLIKVDVPENVRMRTELEDFLRDSLAGIGGLVLDAASSRASNTIYFYLKKLPSDVALAMFDLQGLELSAGSACSSGAARPSAILLQKGLTEVAKNGLRLSHGFQLTRPELEEIKRRLTKIFEKLKTLG